MDIPQLGATHDRRLERRASRGSCEREGSEHRPENIAGRMIAGAATPAAPSSPAPRRRRGVTVRLAGRAVHAGERTRHRDHAQWR
jgi:hypothetical protein